MKKIYKNLHITSDSLTKVLTAINKPRYAPRIIGGYVRDKLLSIDSNDIDIASPLRPEEVMELLRNNRINAVPTGIEFGTITAVIDKIPFEITSLRKDIKCYGRRAEVEFTEDFAIDAARRDFTINALSYCPFEHIIYDYTNGLSDLESKKVRFIGDASERIKEDYLRILRFFRFSSNYADSLDQEGYDACKDNKDGLESLSRERIKSEMDKILLSRQSFKMLSAIKRLNIRIFKDLNIDEKALLNLESKDLAVIYAALFANNDHISLKASLHDLCFTKKMNRMILQLQSIKNSEDILYDLSSYFIDLEKMDPYIAFALAIKKITKLEAIELLKKFSMQPPLLPVKSSDLLRLKITGPQLGICLRAIKKQWIKSNFTLNKKELLKDYIR